jgi:hypothetical protein
MVQLKICDLATFIGDSNENCVELIYEYVKVPRSERARYNTIKSSSLYSIKDPKFKPQSYNGDALCSASNSFWFAICDLNINDLKEMLFYESPEHIRTEFIKNDEDILPIMLENLGYFKHRYELYSEKKFKPNYVKKIKSSMEMPAITLQEYLDKDFNPDFTQKLVVKCK